MATAPPSPFDVPTSVVAPTTPTTLTTSPPSPFAPEVKSVPVASLPNAPSISDTVTPKPIGGDSNAFYQQGTAPILAMQKSLIRLASIIASHDIHSVVDRTTNKNEFLTGSNPFMNFLITNYANKASLVGKQFVDTDLKQPVRMDTAKENDNLKGVLATIMRIGTPGKEQQADGVWGPRTNNALKQIYALADAMLELKDDMGVEVQGYDDSDLTVLSTNIPQDVSEIKNINDKVRRASEISKNLDKLGAFYTNFSEKILNDPNYRAHISQEKPLLADKASHADRGKAQQSDINQEVYKQYNSTPVDVQLPDGKMMTILPYNLYEMNNFIKFINTHQQDFNLTPEETESLKKNDMNVINKALNQVINGIKFPNKEK